MATSDVPGHRPENKDQLAMGCWAEHKDGSLIFVESTEGGTVVYCLFDMVPDPPVQYRDAMEIEAFKRQFSFRRVKGAKKSIKEDKVKDKLGAKDVDDDLRDIQWTWHDKTPFDWSRVMNAKIQDGVGYPSADQQLSAAERVAKSRHLRKETIDIDSIADMLPKERLAGAAKEVLTGIQRAIERLGL